MDAMSDPEHVCYFVSHNRHGAKFDEIIIYLVFVHFEKALVVPRKRKNSSSFFNAGQPKHEIPLLAWIKVSHADPYHAKAIGRQALFEFLKNSLCVVLRFFGIGVDSFGNSVHRTFFVGYLNLHRMKVALTVSSQLPQKLLANVLQRFDVYYISFFVNFVVHLTFVGIIALALLFMLVEPLPWLRLIHGFEHVFDAL